MVKPEDFHIFEACIDPFGAQIFQGFMLHDIRDNDHMYTHASQIC